MQKYIDRIALDFDMPCSTADEQRAVWEALGRMHSWNFKGAKPKDSRWFSWQNACHQQLREWHGTKLILSWYLDNDEPDSDLIQAAATFDALRKQAGGGGLTLALYSLNQKIWERTKVLYLCTIPCWSEYTRFNTSVKSASDCLAYFMCMSNDGWSSCQELQELSQIVSPEAKSQFDSWVQWCPDPCDIARTSFEFVTSLLGQRASSYAKHLTPPYCYAGMLSDDPHMEVRRMKRDWQALVQLETSTAEQASQLAKDLRSTLPSPMRLVMLTFESVGWQVDDPRASGAIRMLGCMLKRLPDSKLIEDYHQRLKAKQRYGAHHQKRRLSSFQHIQNFSDELLAARDVVHPTITEGIFRTKYRQTNSKSFSEAKHMNSRRHKLAKDFQAIMSPNRDWSTLTVASLRKSAAGWQWIRHYLGQKLWQQKVPIKAWSLFF